MKILSKKIVVAFFIMMSLTSSTAFSDNLIRILNDRVDLYDQPSSDTNKITLESYRLQLPITVLDQYQSFIKISIENKSYWIKKNISIIEKEKKVGAYGCSISKNTPVASTAALAGLQEESSKCSRQ